MNKSCFLFKKFKSKALTFESLEMLWLLLMETYNILWKHFSIVQVLQTFHLINFHVENNCFTSPSV